MIENGHLKLVDYELESKTTLPVKKVIAVDDIGKKFLNSK